MWARDVDRALDEEKPLPEWAADVWHNGGEIRELVAAQLSASSRRLTIALRDYRKLSSTTILFFVSPRENTRVLLSEESELLSPQTDEPRARGMSFSIFPLASS